MYIHERSLLIWPADGELYFLTFRSLKFISQISHQTSSCGLLRRKSKSRETRTGSEVLLREWVIRDECTNQEREQNLPARLVFVCRAKRSTQQMVCSAAPHLGWNLSHKLATSPKQTRPEPELSYTPEDRIRSKLQNRTVLSDHKGQDCWGQLDRHLHPEPELLQSALLNSSRYRPKDTN